MNVVPSLALQGTKSVSDLLEEWRLNFKIRSASHYISASSYGKLNYKVGIPATIFTTISGTAVVADVEVGDPTWDVVLRIVAGTLALMGSILTGLMTFFDFSVLRDKHLKVANGYGIIIREVEQLQTIHLDMENPEHVARITELREKISETINNSPEIDSKAYKSAYSMVEREEKHRNH